MNEDAEVVTLLLEKLDPSAIDKHGWIALHYASLYGHHESVSALLKKSNSHLNEVTALQIAETIEVLLRARPGIEKLQLQWPLNGPGIPVEATEHIKDTLPDGSLSEVLKNSVVIIVNGPGWHL
jgi:ankyrin repeat protein